jgi:hypothetical protein
MQILNRHHFPELPKNSVYVGRGTFFGNPYVIDVHGNRSQVIAQFHEDVKAKLANEDPVFITALRGLSQDTDLMCSCAPKPCHAESIAWGWRQLHKQGLPQRPASLAYAGIGSRRTPPEVIRLMQKTAARLEELGYTLRSGAADGADAAFESGVKKKKEIYLPFKGFKASTSEFYTPSDDAMAIAKLVHPAWGALGDTARKLQARNGHQILGLDLRTPVEFVVCWTPAGEETEAERTRDTGGTGQAISLASRWRIPVFNLQRKDALLRLKDFLDGDYHLPPEPELDAEPEVPESTPDSQGALF